MYNNSRDMKGKGKRQTDRTEYTWSVIATWDGTKEAVLFYFYHSSSFLIISFSLEYNNRRAGRDQWQHGTGRRGRQAGAAGTSSVTVSSFYYISSFLLLAFIISFVVDYSNRWGGDRGDGTTRAATAMRDRTEGRRAGGGGRR